jgi:hypothetical protein
MQRGKPRFGRSLTLPGASLYLRRACHEQASARRMGLRQPATYLTAWVCLPSFA